MIFESILIVIFAIILDFIVGDPRNKFHPTSWIGSLIAKLVPSIKNESPKIEKLGGILLVIIVVSIVSALLVFLNMGIQNISIEILGIIISIISGTILLKTTIAIRGMEKHAIAVMDSLDQNDLKSARNNLSMIVKRNTNNLDKNHVLSGTLESISENTVDGITGPLFYFTFFGIIGAFTYRIVNTIDSMIGYKSGIFRNIGWFGANCDNILNYLPARITGIMMVLGALILGHDWKKSYQILRRDGKKTESPNAGYPMAALAGALGTRFEKINNYCIGDDNFELTKDHFHAAISLMKITSILFCMIFTVPVIIILSYFGWWFNV
ncbi:MAG: cobalamin biosynthesis protein [Nitrosopumilaceae archaeon]